MSWVWIPLLFTYYWASVPQVCALRLSTYKLRLRWRHTWQPCPQSNSMSQSTDWDKTFFENGLGLSKNSCQNFLVHVWYHKLSMAFFPTSSSAQTWLHASWETVWALENYAPLCHQMVSMVFKLYIVEKVNVVTRLDFNHMWSIYVLIFSNFTHKYNSILGSSHQEVTMGKHSSSSSSSSDSSDDEQKRWKKQQKRQRKLVSKAQCCSVWDMQCRAFLNASTGIDSDVYFWLPVCC